MTERKYIAYRKIKVAVRSAAFYLCRIFPIDRNLICVCFFEGKGRFGCNPKYIVQELHKERPDLKFVCISGTKGYIIAQSLWWLMKHFEVRYEDENKVESYDPTFRGDGLRYEIEGFLMQISGMRTRNKEMQNVSIFAAEIMEEFLKKRMSQNGI